MENFINTMVDFAMGIVFGVTGAANFLGRRVVGVAERIRVRITRYFAFLFYGTLSSLLLLILAVLIKNQALVVSSGIVSACMLLLIYLTFLIPAQVIATLSNGLIRKFKPDYDLLQDIESTDVDRIVRSALFPLLSTAFFVACLASIIASRGFHGISIAAIGVYATLILVFIIFSLFFKGHTLIAHSFVLILVIWNFLVYTYPIPTKSLVLRGEDKVNGWFITGKSSAESQIIIVPAGVQLYQTSNEEGFLATEITTEATRAKIISIAEDAMSDERLYKVILANSKGEYIGGKIVYVSLRSIELIKKDIQDKPVIGTIQNINNEKVIPPKAANYLLTKDIPQDLLPVDDDSWVHYWSEKPFYSLEYQDKNNKQNLTRILLPAGKGQRYATWGGPFRVLSLEDNKISVWTSKSPE